MIFIRLTFFILVLMSLNVFSQIKLKTSELNKEPQAYKFDEYGKITNKDLQTRLHKFVRYAIDNDADRGVIFLYVKNKKNYDLRVRMIMNNWTRNLCHWDCIRFTFVRANYTNDERTEFWVVPKGAELPEPKN